MTVCLALICEGFYGKSVVVAVSDRMITAGDIEFQWDRPKGQELGSGCLLMGAGSATAHAEIRHRVVNKLSDKVSEKRQMADMAGLVGAAFSELRFEKAVDKHLRPLGLDGSSFLAGQDNLSPEEVRRLNRALTDEDLGTELIVAGIDDSGPHLYLVEDPGVVECHDDVGFLAIGLGARSAEAVFMTGGYSRNTPVGRAALRAYVAKKRSEVAPGVGIDTDMRIVWNSTGIGAANPKAVDNIFLSYYQQILDGEKAIRTDAEDAINKKFEEQFEKRRSKYADSQDGESGT